MSTSICDLVYKKTGFAIKRLQKPRKKLSSSPKIEKNIIFKNFEDANLQHDASSSGKI